MLSILYVLSLKCSFNLLLYHINLILSHSVQLESISHDLLEYPISHALSYMAVKHF